MVYEPCLREVSLDRSDNFYYTWSPSSFVVEAVSFVVEAVSFVVEAVILSSKLSLLSVLFVLFVFSVLFVCLGRLLRMFPVCYPQMQKHTRRLF